MRDPAGRLLYPEPGGRVETSLTIAIPTYNRAELLDRQLAWLDRALAGVESHCEVLVSDNRSTDRTPGVIADWRARFGGRVAFRSVRNDRNVGAIRNIAGCILAARTSHVWTVGDDDRIDDDTLRFVLEELRRHPVLALLTLNFSSRFVETGELRFERCYQVDDDSVHADGRRLFERCLADDAGGVALTTAQIYRTDLAQAAIGRWRRGLNNLVTQIYWTGFCAAHGAAKVTPETHLECAAGTHFFVGNPKLSYKLDLGDSVELYARLAMIGYSPELCLRLAKQQVAGQKRRLVKGAVRWPATGLAAIGRIALSFSSLYRRSLASGAA
jgi:abequosyltransferase